jgi:hypothetical protein
MARRFPRGTPSDGMLVGNFDCLVKHAVANGQALRPLILTLSRQGDGSEPVSRSLKRGYELMKESSEIEGLYGKMTIELTVKAAKIEIVNPFLLLEHAAAKCRPFFLFIRRCVSKARNGILNIVLYHDGVTPGNVHRADAGRQFVSFLWSMLEIPDHHRGRDRLRWFLAAYVEKKKMDEHNITVGHVFMALLRYYFKGHDYNFSTTGIKIKNGSDELIVLARFSCTPQDYLAHVDLYCLKGSSALAPCAECENVIGRRDFFSDDSGFVHVCDHEYKKCIRRTHARACDIVNKLRELAIAGQVAQ